MLFRDHELPEVQEVKWEELSLKEQRVFLQNGYKVPEGTILRNNLDIEYENTREFDTR